MNSNLPPQKAPCLFFDLEDLFFQRRRDIVTHDLLKAFLVSEVWIDYNRGVISRDQCYSKLATRFSVPLSTVDQALTFTPDSLQLDHKMVDFLQTLKSTLPTVRVYAMINSPKPDWEILKLIGDHWLSLFDGTFVSFDIGMCKPELNFYHFVLQSTKTEVASAIFIDSEVDNVVSARSIGARAIHYTELSHVQHQLNARLGDPSTRGRDFLRLNAQSLDSISNTGVPLKDNYAQLLILEALGDQSLIKLNIHERTWNYWTGEGPHLMPLPNDCDTTSLALINLAIDDKICNSVMDEILDMTNADGIILTYFDTTRPRICPVVCANILRMFYKFGRGMEPALQPTKDWIRQVLIHRAYVGGTRYYHTPEVFLFYLAQLFRHHPDSDMAKECTDLLRKRLMEQMNTDGDGIQLAMRILSFYHLEMDPGDGLVNADVSSLLSLQNDDGGWETGWLCRTGRRGIRIGNRGLTTALAVCALDAIPRGGRSKAGLS
ncbi:hypothetical protein N7540_001705 [Penicillium herquei]|nr:hypothetical protein N7540_001705 [Penicillium herquei]